MAHPRVPFVAGPPKESDALSAALQAIREEARRDGRSIVLVAHAVQALPAVPEFEFGIFAIDVGPGDFDWTFEGSIAWSTAVRSVDHDGPPTPEDIENLDDSCLWRAEVVEVDAILGRLWVAVEKDASPPVPGRFSVQPFGFLAALERIFASEDFRAARADLTIALNLAAGLDRPRRYAPSPDPPEVFGDAWCHTVLRLWGPPGTGKTFSIGKTVREIARDHGERILVVAPTNRAADGAALAIGQAMHAAEPQPPKDGSVIRIGRGADAIRFRTAGLTSLLRAGDDPDRYIVADLRRRFEKTIDRTERAILSRRIRDAMRRVDDGSSAFLHPRARVVVTTIYGALSQLATDALKDLLEAGEAPFTTVIIDEAGLVSRAHSAALMLLAARRVVLVGDPRQLSPISRVMRVLPSRAARWLAESALGHLRPDVEDPAVCMLTVQHRMAPDVRKAVSEFTYAGRLTDAEEVVQRSFFFPLDAPLADEPRAIWYVLDDDAEERKDIAAERPDDGRSWVRRGTLRVLEKIFESHPNLAAAEGLFLTPFAAQARAVAAFFATRGDVRDWRSSTLHQRQGSEADYVVFDTVNAGSTGFAFDEWRRLLNVGLSRARESVILLASRAEMREPYMADLADLLAPRIIARRGARWEWVACPKNLRHQRSALRRTERPDRLGAQLDMRRMLRPVLSAEQESLCALEMDGGPRLVRGVAGSGKSWVLAHWLAKTLRRHPEMRVLVVYGNVALRTLLLSMIDAAWDEIGGGEAVPWRSIDMRHVGAILAELAGKASASTAPEDYDFDWNRMAAAIRAARHSAPEPAVDALFIDEAQDFGPAALGLLTELVRPEESMPAAHRRAMIFYDNAQNIYRRPTPVWSELGLDMRGRSRIMKESFRATVPIVEFALNLLARTGSIEDDPDQKEMLDRGRIEKTERLGRPWYRAHYATVEGPWPEIVLYPRRQDEWNGALKALRTLIDDEGVRPSDITCIVNHRRFGAEFEAHIQPALAPSGARAVFVSGRSFDRDERTILITTPHSFKGWDAEVVCVIGLDLFGTSEGPLAANLYVAMTRARSILRMSGLEEPESSGGRTITDVAVRTILDLKAAPETLSAPGAESWPAPAEDDLAHGG